MFDIQYKSISSDTSINSCDVLIDFLDSSDFKTGLSNFENSSGIEIPAILKKKFQQKSEKQISFYTNSRPAIVYLFKFDADKINTDYFRNSVARIISGLFGENIESVFIRVPEYEISSSVFEDKQQYYRSFVEGAGLGNYEFNKYKSDKKKNKKLKVDFLSKDEKEMKQAVSVSENILEAVYFTRDIINEPAIQLTPAELAKQAKKKLNDAGIEVTIWDKKEIEKNKMNAILAVGGASVNEPKLIVMKYSCGKKKAKHIGLVGKGVTYDSGGLSIKPTSGMFDMKIDMAGAAAVIGAVLSAAKNKIDVNITAVIPAVENMVSGSSYKPGDVIKTYSGKTIEVMDTDAEGRIILADALYYISKQNPDEIIDLATLTGACVVALGEYAAGMFSKNDEISDKLYKAGMQTFERVWRLPFWDEYGEMLKSDIADVANLGPRWGGAITAGKFLENFVTKPENWVHLDLAPAGKNKLSSYMEKYHPGFGVRLLYRYFEMTE